MVDRPKLDQMLSSLRRYVAVLRALGAAPRDEFLGNPDKIGNASETLPQPVEHVFALELHRA